MADQHHYNSSLLLLILVSFSLYFCMFVNILFSKNKSKIKIPPRTLTTKGISFVEQCGSVGSETQIFCVTQLLTSTHGSLLILS